MDILVIDGKEYFPVSEPVATNSVVRLFAKDKDGFRYKFVYRIDFLDPDTIIGLGDGREHYILSALKTHSDTLNKFSEDELDSDIYT